jgi:hypothetical protein
MQTRLESLIEQALNVGSGFIVSSLVWEFIVKPVWHFNTDIVQNLQITALFTVISILRGYLWRRTFNKRSRVLRRG